MQDKLNIEKSPMCINLFQVIFGSPLSKEGEVVFDDNNFIRTIYRKNCDQQGFASKLTLTEDRVPRLELSNFHIALAVTESLPIRFLLHNQEFSHFSSSSDSVLFASKDQSHAFWIPRSPMLRQRDINGRIVREIPLAFSISILGKDFVMDVSIPEEGILEFPLVTCASDVTDFLTEVTSVPLYKGEKILVIGPCSEIKALPEFWDYMIGELIYDSRFFKLGRCKSEQVALSLYEIAHSVLVLRGQRIYEFLMTKIAYCVMLDLDENGVWRHGYWTDGMETHTRMQIDGIHLLVNYYQRTKKGLFLQKALQATKFLLSIADITDFGLWFLHDTLELSEKRVSTYYQMTKTRAFGKSKSNTLTLNTHVSMLILLCRLNECQNVQDFTPVIQSGMNTLKAICQQRPLNSIYTVIFFLFDKYYLSSNNSLFARIVRKFVKKSVIYLKSRFPRLIMPNGYIDRDLNISNLCINYHIINLWDLLRLYNFRKEEWLLEIIANGVDYCYQSKYLQFLFDSKDVFLPIFLEVLVMYSYKNKKFDTKKISEFKRFLREYDFGFTLRSIGLPNLLNASFSPSSLSRRDN